MTGGVFLARACEAESSSSTREGTYERAVQGRGATVCARDRRDAVSPSAVESADLPAWRNRPGQRSIRSRGPQRPVRRRRGHLCQGRAVSPDEQHQPVRLRPAGRREQHRSSVGAPGAASPGSSLTGRSPQANRALLHAVPRLSLPRPSCWRPPQTRRAFTRGHELHDG